MKKILVVFTVFLMAASVCVADDMYAAFVKFDGIPSELEVMGTSGWIALVGFEIGVAEGSGVISKPLISFTPTKIITPDLNSIEGLSEMSLACVKEMDAISPKIASAFNQRIKIPDAIEPLLATLKGEDRDTRLKTAEALKQLYRHGKLDDAAKAKVLAHRQAIEKKYHSDEHWENEKGCVSGHFDTVTGVDL